MTALTPDQSLFLLTSRRARCLFEISREELSDLPYAHEAAPGALCAVVRSFTTDPRPGIIANDSHDPAFALRTDKEIIHLRGIDEIDRGMRPVAGAAYTAVRTDPSLMSWVHARLKGRCPDIADYSETFEAICLRDAVILHDLDYAGPNPSLRVEDQARVVLERIDIAFPEDLSQHALLQAIAGVQRYLEDTLYDHLDANRGLPRASYRIQVLPPW